VKLKRSLGIHQFVGLRLLSTACLGLVVVVVVEGCSSNAGYHSHMGLKDENCCSHIREGWDTHVKYAFAPSAVNCRGIQNAAAVNCRGIPR
jgi:hypothetical protein